LGDWTPELEGPKFKAESGGEILGKGAVSPLPPARGSGEAL